MQLILNGDTRPILFFLAQSGDHVSGLVGAASRRVRWRLWGMGGTA
jgi:hypothetical protein